MGGRLLLIALLLAGSAGGIYLLIPSLRDDWVGTGARTEEQRREEEWAKGRRSVPVERQAAPPETPPETGVDPAEEPADKPEEEPRPISPPEDITDYADLVIELARPKETEERSILVVVTDTQGEPLEEVLIVVRSGGSVVYRERTDDRGVVEFDPYDDEDGPFRIDALAPFYSPTDATEVKPGADVDLVLEAQPWLEGRVIAPSQGHGIVTLFTEAGRETTKVNPDGTFLFEGLDPGWVTVQADVDPYGAASEELELVAGNGSSVSLRVRARNRVRIFGDILNWPGEGDAFINNVKVAVSANGRYTFKNGVIGRNRIVIDAPGKALFEKTFDVKGRKKSKYDFRVQGDAFIAGRVTAGGLRVAGAEVRLGIDYNDPLNEDRLERFPLERLKPVFTDKEGRFEVRRLIRGVAYLISVVKHPYGQVVERYTASSLGVHRIELPSKPFIYGRLRGLGGIPHHAIVTAQRLSERDADVKFNVPNWDGSRSERDDKGYYGLSGLLPDVYLIRAEAVGYGSVETVVDLTSGRRSRMDLRLRKGDFGEDDDAELLKRLPPVVEDLDDVDESLRDDGTILTVDARRADDEGPFPGVRVRFFEGETEFTAPMSFREAKFDLFGLPEATYRAVLSHPLLKEPIIVDNIRLVRGDPFTLVLKPKEE